MGVRWVRMVNGQGYALASADQSDAAIGDIPLVGGRSVGEKLAPPPFLGAA